MNVLNLLKSYQLTVKSLKQVGDFCLLDLAKPEGLNWAPASYARFVLPDKKPSRTTERALTLASLPEQNVISVLFRSGETGSHFKQTLSMVREGQIVTMRYLYSHLKPDSIELPQLFFSSDVGIAAVRPLAIDILKAGAPKLTIHHLSRGCDVFDSELTQLAQKNQNISYHPVCEEIDMEEALARAATHFGNQAVYYLVGPPQHVSSWVKLLKVKKISSKHIKKEPFTGLSI